MAHPFGDQDQSPGGAAKRPAQTIEGTATEVKVEPEPGETARAEPEAKTQNSEAPSAAEAAPSQAGRIAAAAAPGRVKSFFTHCVAGLLGGLVGVAALAYAWSGLDLGQGAKPAPDIAALEQRLAKLEAAPPASVDAEALSALEAQLAGLEANVKEMSPKLAGLADRVAQLETSLKTLAETASEGGSVATAAAIAQQIAEAEQRLDAKIAASLADGKGASAAALEQMRTEIAELKAKLGALAEAELGTGDAISPDLAALDRADRQARGDAAGDRQRPEQRVGRRQVCRGRHRLRQSQSRGQRRPALRRRARHHQRARPVGRRPWRRCRPMPRPASRPCPSWPAPSPPPGIMRLRRAAPAAGGSLVDNLMASAQSLVKIRRDR